MEERPADVYLIHPVENLTEEERRFLDSYVESIERRGYKVHYPIRDVDQNDSSGGVRIMKEHRVAMGTTREVHVYWNPKSRGSVFDLGMGFYAEKPIVLVNPDEIREVASQRAGKCFEKILLQISVESQLV